MTTATERTVVVAHRWVTCADCGREFPRSRTFTGSGAVEHADRWVPEPDDWRCRECLRWARLETREVMGCEP